jgi:hypothetical protein
LPSVLVRHSINICLVLAFNSPNIQLPSTKRKTAIMPELLKAFLLFGLAAVCEIGGAYLIWQWQRADKPALWALLGLAGLFLYSLIQTVQSFGFGRAFAAYGGIFIFTALV